MPSDGGRRPRPAAAESLGRPAAVPARQRGPELLAGWGRVPTVAAPALRSDDLRSIALAASLTRGLGRSYGDAALPAGGEPVAVSTRADRVLRVDWSAGVVRAEAGLRLGELQELLLARGWSVPVLPGTRHVTLGGMVAADVHGKDHHAVGCLGEHVRSLTLLVADGRVVEAGEATEPDLFRATLGGMGLTAHVLEVELQLVPVEVPWIVAGRRVFEDLDAGLDALAGARRRWPFTVAWLDGLARGARLGRGVLHHGRWAEPGEAPPPAGRRWSWRVPCHAPGWVLSRPLLRAHAALELSRSRAARTGPAHPAAFFHPLDAVSDWNRLHGRRGFVQHQSVVPAEEAAGAFRRMLELASAGPAAPTLAVLKDCGPQGRGLLSFPMSGVSLALDLPMLGEATRRTVDRLNETVLAAGGRIYLAKDALTRREHFEAMEAGRLPAFRRIRDAWDPDRRIRSALSVRLMGDPR